MDARLIALGAVLVAAAFALALYGGTSEEVIRGNLTLTPKFVYTYEHTYVIKARYLIKNPLNRTTKDFIYIAIPRNTTFQHSYLISIEPKPVRVQLDEDDNVFAVIELKLKPGEKFWIRAEFKVTMTEYAIDEKGVTSTWPPMELVAKLTGPTSLWNTENETLIEVANKYGKGDTPLEIVKNLASWLVQRINYQVKGGRLGSDRALVAGPKGLEVRGDCVEVADVMVTLARIKGIPARTVYGFMLTSPYEKMWLNLTTAEKEGEELLKHWGGHMWSQVYVPPWGWIDVELLEGRVARVGEYTWRHVVLGFEETRYYGTTLTNMCLTGYLELEYVEYEFSKVRE